MLKRTSTDHFFSVHVNTTFRSEWIQLDWNKR